VAALGDESPLPAEFSTTFRDSGVPVFRSAERAMRALALATAYGRALQASGEKAPLAHDAVPPLPPRGGVLPEYVGKAFLKALGIAVPAGALAADLAAATAIATSIGYPVALKAQAASLTHKSDAGGVILSVENDSALTKAWQRMQDNMARAGVTPDGVLVETMAGHGLDMIVGARRDPDWGAVLMVGLGGIFVETLGDVRLMPAELPKAGVLAEIARLQCAPLLRGARGQPPADIDALADAIVRIGAAMRARPEITEIDINPLRVLEAGRGVVALDALIVTTP
jgi:acyl-CoA synthetase (NDP forming)